MGNWNINIQGIGCHHNSSPKDANEIAKECVEQLIKAGHLVHGASFTYGAADSLIYEIEEEQANTVHHLAESVKCDPAGIPTTVLPPSKE